MKSFLFLCFLSSSLNTEFREVSGSFTQRQSRKLQSSSVISGVQFGRLEITGINNYVRVDFSKPFSDPVVVPMVITHNSENSTSCRIKDLDSSGFYIALETYLSAGHINSQQTEQVSYIAVDANQELPYNIQAGNLDLTGEENFSEVQFSGNYSEAPCLLAFVQTKNNQGFAMALARFVSSGSFQIALDSLGLGDPIGSETVGWIAVPPGAYFLGVPAEFGTTPVAVNHEPYDLNTKYLYPGVPIPIASRNSFNGGDGAFARGFSVEEFDLIRFRLQEDEIYDPHTFEILSWAAFFESECYFIQGVCQDFCPSGFTLELGSCKKFQDLVLHLEFNEVNDVLVDKAQGVKVYTGEDNSFYPDYGKHDPIAAYKRGYYFTGSSYMKFPEYPELDLSISPEFTLTAWIRPDTTSSNQTILNKQSKDKNLLEFFLHNADLGVSGTLLGDMNFFYSNEQVQNRVWSLVFVRTYLDEDSHHYQFEIGKNLNLVNLASTEQKTWFYDELQNYSLIIGTQLSLSNYFKGFLYELRIYNENTPLDQVVSQSCEESCSFCPSSECIVSCDIDERWTGKSYNDCGKCGPDCLDVGCVRLDKRCNLCSDPLCKVCVDYVTCTECLENSSLEEGVCMCNQGYFDDSGVCTECLDLCLTCSGNSTCDTCVENSSLEEGVCMCNQGYLDDSGVCTECLDLCETFYAPAYISSSMIFFSIVCLPLANKCDKRLDRRVTINETKRTSSMVASEEQSKFPIRILEGHLTLGLFYFRKDYSRVSRVYTMLVVHLLQAFFTGVIIYASQDTQSDSDSKEIWFGVAGFSASLGPSLGLMKCMASENPNMFFGGICLSVVVVLGSFSGVLGMAANFCRSWSLVWVVSMGLGALLQVSVSETLYMGIRYFLLKVKTSE